MAPAARRGFAVLILRSGCQRVKVKGAMNARRRHATAGSQVTVRMKGTYLRAAN